VGQIILQFDGSPAHSPNDLIGKVTNSKVGSRVPLQVFRNGKNLDLSVKIGRRPNPDVRG
jgi:S1-C subfamily serine protease